MRGGGCVVRLAGLYSLQRGPHSVWLGEKSVSGFRVRSSLLSVRFYRYTFFRRFHRSRRLRVRARAWYYCCTVGFDRGSSSAVWWSCAGLHALFSHPAVLKTLSALCDRLVVAEKPTSPEER